MKFKFGIARGSQKRHRGECCITVDRAGWVRIHDGSGFITLRDVLRKPEVEAYVRAKMRSASLGVAEHQRQPVPMPHKANRAILEIDGKGYAEDSLLPSSWRCPASDFLRLIYRRRDIDRKDGCYHD